MKINDFRERKHSLGSILSYNALNFGVNISGYIFSSRLLFFYETEVLLPISLITVAITLWTIWDMVNDPIIGHFCDRNFKFTKRWGKRFPWIVLGTIPLTFIMILFFIPPDPGIDIWATFYWLLFVLLLYDTCSSTLGVNYLALTPNKFRSKEERVRVASYSRIFITSGTVLGFILPSIFIKYGDKSSYFPLALISALMLIFSLIFGIPGLREEKELVETYFQVDAKKQPFSTEFVDTLKKAFKQKNFKIYLILSLSLAVHTALLTSSIPYYARYIARAPPIFEIIVYLPWILTGVLLLPFYYWLVKRHGHQKVARYSFLLIPFSTLPLFFTALPLFFISTYQFFPFITSVFISAAFMGAINGLNNIVLLLSVLDFFDEAAVLNKKRQEGMYNGIIIFFGNLVQIFSVVIFWIVHELTGFVPESLEQTVLAQFGILFIMSIIPMIASAIGVAIFIKKWDLTPEKILHIKTELKELNL